MAELTIRERQTGDVTILQLQGKITIGSDAVLRPHLPPQERSPDKPRWIIIDLAGLLWADTGGVSSLIAIHNAIAGAGGQLRLINVPAQFRSMFDGKGLDIHDSEQSALKSFR